MKRKIATRLLVFGMSFMTFFSLRAQQAPSEIADSLQSILELSLPSGFQNSGAIMTVTVPGQWSWSGATGNAISGMTQGQTLTMAQATDKFRAGSITKMMIAVCILKLQEEGLLSINAPIGNYLRATLVNDTIQSSELVRVRHLLNHTSGIANSGDNTACQQDVLTNPLGAHSLEDAIYCGASQGEIFPPEFAWAYSNTNYSILAMIINNVSGMDYRDYLYQTIIQPLNLSNTEIPTTNQINGSHMGCYWNIGSWIDLTVINPTTYAGWADVVSTTQDLTTFYQALRAGTIINAQSLDFMKTMYPGTLDYGLGYDHYVMYDEFNYDGHYGEVANTSGLFYCDLVSDIAPNGYYISYNFNVQGAEMQTKIDIPVFDLLRGMSGTNGVKEQQLAHFEVYPNPVNDRMNISFSTSDDRQLKLFNNQGKLVYEKSINGEEMHSVIDCSTFTEGLYMLQIKTDGGVEVRKIIRN